MTKGSSGFSREELDAALMQRYRRDFEAGEHEALWPAIKIVYDSNFPMEDWLYKAIIAWLDRTETRKQKKDRYQRVVDLARLGYVLDHVQRGRKVDAAVGIASDELKEYGFAGSPAPGSVDRSYKAAKKRIMRHTARKPKGRTKKVAK